MDIWDRLSEEIEELSPQDVIDLARAMHEMDRKEREAKLPDELLMAKIRGYIAEKKRREGK